MSFHLVCEGHSKRDSILYIAYYQHGGPRHRRMYAASYLPSYPYIASVSRQSV